MKPNTLCCIVLHCATRGSIVLHMRQLHLQPLYRLQAIWASFNYSFRCHTIWVRFNIHCFRTRVMATGWENRCDNGRHLKKKFKKVGRGDISEVAQSDVCPTERGPKKIRRVRKKTKMGTLRNGRLDQGTFLPRARRPMGLSGALGALGAFAGGRPGSGPGALWICAILLLTLTWGAQANSAGEILNSSSNISFAIKQPKLPPTSPIPTPIHRH